MVQPPSPSADQEIETLLARGVNLPPQPRILQEIDVLAQRDDVTLRAIAALVGRDAGLTARLFKVVHSPVFGLRREVDSLDEALSLMGLKPALTVIKSAALRDAIGDPGAQLDAFWDRANDIAVLCSLIARRQRDVLRIAPEHAHMAGLFHDCGVPILMQRFPGYCRDIARTWPDLEQEDAAHNTSHAVVGYLLARNWKLPQPVSQAIRHHHDPAQALAAETPLIAVLLLATHLRNLFYGYHDTGWAAVETNILAELGISPLTRNEFTDEILHQFQESLN